MREPRTIFLILIVIACIVSAGCVQSSGYRPVPPGDPATDVPAPEPGTPVPAAVTSAPSEIVTIIRYVSPPRDLKDSELLFSLQVPAEWNVSTWRLTNSDTSDFRTDLVPGNVFTVHTYPASRSREQEYRDQFRHWSPAPVESPVTINDIRYDRYESRANGTSTVAYLARATCANERGYGSVLLFVARDSNRFEREDFEAVVSSFRYFGTRSASTMPGEEIPRYDLSGNSVSRVAGVVDPRIFDTSDWDTAGGDFSGEGSPGGSSSGGGSTGGGSCRG